MTKKPKEPEKTPIEIAQSIADTSGNTFHYKVIKLLKEHGWTVLISPYYVDSLTEKPREIDIIAEKPFTVCDRFDSASLGQIHVRLLIECKYIKNPIVFWFDQRDREKAEQRAIAETGAEKTSLTTECSTHHYLSTKPVAKLYESDRAQSQDGDFMFKALTQVLNSFTYYKNGPSILTQISRGGSQEIKRLSYPIIVSNSFDNLFSVNPNEEKASINRVNDPFQIELNYVSKGNYPEYFLVDVLSINHLPDFLDHLFKNDVAITNEKIGWDTIYQGRET